ncbi:MAG: hypothetical protein QF819_00145 [Gemmatimonadota bacterium]|jgi:hypothetical protein|nr:hypothetical protein [Gemmatimonadota bacterium]MDP6528591.1 hypothetical protein [Gemmatimonadota bacterium]MDP6801573.1 hypothetical protein [Gemmatimonadota bacterium]MDP7030880.1 hypothetical protein [Gemmatimonadota bacterium]
MTEKEKHSRQEVPEEREDGVRTPEDGAAKGTLKKGPKPAFRFSKLDGRDSLKYEDVADK